MTRAQRLARCPGLMVAALCCLAPDMAAAQVRITAIVTADGSPADSTTDVVLVPWGSLAGQAVRLNQPLGIGDELRATSGRTIIELTCADTAVFTVDGGFRIAIASETPPCVMDLKVGRLFVMGDANTEASLGEVSMGAKRTLYAVTAGRDENGPVRGLIVFDGAVEVRGAGADPLEVGAQQSWIMDRGRGVERVTAEEIAGAAAIYARLDVARATPAARRTRAEYNASYRTLYEAHSQVLQRPTDADSRLNLVNEQLKLNATSRATLYHLQQTRTIDPHSERVQATTAMSAVAYLQLDQPANAAASVQRLQPGAASAVLRQYQLDTAAVSALSRDPARRPLMAMAGQSTVQPPLQVAARATPASARAGQPVAISVVVRNAAGQPLASAAVDITASDGAFRETRRLTAPGVTDANGAFTATWVCATCAGAYQFTITAARRGYVGAETRLRVTVQ